MKEKWEKQKKLDQELIKRGYNRVLDKIKDTRQNFANAVTTRRRSGSGKLVMEFYEKLVKLWGGSPVNKTLTFGVTANSISNNIPNSNTSPVNSCTSSTSCSSKSSALPASENEVQHDSPSGYVPTNSDAEDEGFLADNLSDLSDPLLTSTVKKRKAQEELPRNKCSTSNSVPRLIDNKRKHLKRQLSVAERDKLLINEAKEEVMFRNEMTEAIKESNLTFMRAMETIGTSMTAVAQSLSKSIENMTRACIVNDPPFYHQPPAAHRHGFQFHDMMHDRYAQNTRSFINNDSENQSINPNCYSDDYFGTILKNTMNN